MNGSPNLLTIKQQIQMALPWLAILSAMIHDREYLLLLVTSFKKSKLKTRTPIEKLISKNEKESRLY